MIADHCEVSQLMSLALVRAAQGCLVVSGDKSRDLPAQQYDYRVAFCGNETKHKHILASTVVT